MEGDTSTAMFEAYMEQEVFVAILQLGQEAVILNNLAPFNRPVGYASWSRRGTASYSS